MNIESITIGQVAVFVAFIVALVKGIDAIMGWFKKPAEDVENKIGKRLDKIEADNKMTLKVVYTLLQHEVTGDHANDMDNLYTEVSNYIIDK
jgi:hypothetical protein